MDHRHDKIAGESAKRSLHQWVWTLFHKVKQICQHGLQCTSVGMRHAASPLAPSHHWVCPFFQQVKQICEHGLQPWPHGRARGEPSPHLSGDVEGLEEAIDFQFSEVGQVTYVFVAPLTVEYRICVRQGWARKLCLYIKWYTKCHRSSTVTERVSVQLQLTGKLIATQIEPQQIRQTCYALWDGI